MKNKLFSPVGLNPMGVGPKIFKYTLPFLLVAIALGILFPAFFTFPVSIKMILKYVGWILIAIGILAYFITISYFLKKFSKGILITNGIFALSRNPLYGSWILFILPGISFAADNFLFLLVAVAMYVFFVIYIKEEEESLSKIFGQQYIDYKKKVNRLI